MFDRYDKSIYNTIPEDATYTLIMDNNASEEDVSDKLLIMESPGKFVVKDELHNIEEWIANMDLKSFKVINIPERMVFEVMSITSAFMLLNPDLNLDYDELYPDNTSFSSKDDDKDVDEEDRIFINNKLVTAMKILGVFNFLKQDPKRCPKLETIEKANPEELSGTRAYLVESNASINDKYFMSNTIIELYGYNIEEYEFGRINLDKGVEDNGDSPCK